MEELRSTEILDKEIHEDARKKAERILANADSECAKVLAGVDGRISAIRKEKEAYYKEKLAALKKDSDAAVPLEQERFLVSFEGHSVMSAINRYLQNIGSEKQQQLIEKLVKGYKKVFENKKLTARLINFDFNAGKEMLENIFGKENVFSCSELDFSKSNLEEPEGLEIHKGILLEAEDGSVRCRATLGEVIAELLDTHSEELAVTLFHGGLPV